MHLVLSIAGGILLAFLIIKFLPHLGPALKWFIFRFIPSVFLMCLIGGLAYASTQPDGLYLVGIFAILIGLVIAGFRADRRRQERIIAQKIAQGTITQH